MNSPVSGFVMNTTSGAFIGTLNDTASRMQFDFVVMATDLPGLKQVLTRTADTYQNDTNLYNRVSCILKKVNKLNVAPPYKIMRVWFDKQLEGANTKNILETPEFSPINLIVQYHTLEEEYMVWANKTGGSVMEFHLYQWKYGDISDDKVWNVIAPTVKDIYPEIFERNFTTLAYHVNSYHNFPSFERGSAEFRPESTFAKECGIPNTMLAGDWLHTSYPSALMERAVSTGREAANQILLMDHVKQVPLVVTSSHGPGIL